MSMGLHDSLILETPFLLTNPEKQKHTFNDYPDSLAAVITKPIQAHAACSVVDELVCLVLKGWTLLTEKRQLSGVFLVTFS